MRPVMLILCRDINLDGIINAKDLNTEWSSPNYGNLVQMLKKSPAT